MEKLQKAMEKTLIPVANRLSSSKVLRAISSGFSMMKGREVLDEAKKMME